VPEAPAPAPAAIALTTPPAPHRPPQKTVAAAENLSEERLLAAAVRALRAKQDADSALLALDAYRTSYPQGRLFIEASVLRVDALTALHRQPEALRVLDELDLGRMPGGLERRLQRGEMRAASGRFREAVADFDGVLSHARAQDLAERALAGRAQARQRLGDSAGARSDAVAYLRRFPVGPFAPQARDLSQPQTVGP
jgi:outer membrane protein assembly factor BamD (BamD/ComL family)